MIFIGLPILLFLILFNIKFAKPKEYFDATSHKSTNAANGIFVMIIFLSHFRMSIPEWNAYDAAFYGLPVICTQLIVVTFLFFSGYGLMESTKKKGVPYVRSIATKRFPKLLLEFAVCVLLYVAVEACFGVYYDFGHILLSMIGWKGVGNSYWFIFATLAFYIIMFISFLIFRDKKKYLLSVICTTVLVLGYIIAMSYISPNDPWNYNTLLCLPAGQFFSLYKEKIYAFLKYKWWIFWSVFVVLLASFILLYIYCQNTIYWFNLMGIIFVLLIIMFNMKVQVQNPVLDFLGKHTYWMFILQNLFFILYNWLGVGNVNRYLFFFVSLVSTIVLSVVMRILFTKLESLIWREKVKKS